jgi:Phage integrase, N-terminal SAM-like domain
MASGQWIDPDRGKVKLADYAATWIAQRPGLRPRTVDLYRWLLGQHITPYLGGVPVGKVSTAMIREWRATLLGNGVSVSMAAKAYRLLRAVLMTTPRRKTRSCSGTRAVYTGPGTRTRPNGRC